MILPEWLDDTPPAEARPSVRDLVRINRYLGGYSSVRRLMRGIAEPPDSFSVLDIGAASGDMGLAIRRSFPNARVTSLDYRSDHLFDAPAPKVIGDAFALPFAPSSFDFVFTSLFLHHFSDEQVANLLRSFARIARTAVLSIDLARGALAYRFIPATRWLFRWHPITLHDGPISVQASFTRNELLALAHRAGLEKARVEEHRPWSRLMLTAMLS